MQNGCVKRYEDIPRERERERERENVLERNRDTM